MLLTLAAAAGIYDPIRGLPRIKIDPSLNEMLPADDDVPAEHRGRTGTRRRLSTVRRTLAATV